MTMKTTNNVMSFRSLIDEMKAVADGRQKPTVRADKNVYASEAAKSFVKKLTASKTPAPVKWSTTKPVASLNINGLAGVTRLMTRENQALIQLIAKGDVTSVADLAVKSHRAESNLSRTLKKLMEIGILKAMPGRGRAKVPKLAVQSFQVAIDVVTGHVTVVSAEEPAAAGEFSTVIDAQHSKGARRALSASYS